MKKKKSKLQKKIDDVGSSFWRNKSDKLWKELVFRKWDSQCAICHEKNWVQAHHAIPCNMHSHRHIINNGICLCAKHHRFSFELSPHKAPIAFAKWMIKNHPELWNWLLEQEPNHLEVNYKEVYLSLEKLLIMVWLILALTVQ